MDDSQRLKLQELIRENDVVDNTENIRKLKHSDLIRKDIAKLQNIKRKVNSRDFKTLDRECCGPCTFLFNHYTNIYNKLLKDEINIKVLYQFLDALQSIEDGVRDQHEASYEVGMLLRRLYVDKKIKKSDKKKNDIPQKSNRASMSYAEYKRQMNTE